jgi:hypothetical protein
VLLLVLLLPGVDELVQLGNKFVEDIRAGRHQQEGWPNSMYGETHAVGGLIVQQLPVGHAPSQVPHPCCSFKQAVMCRCAIAMRLLSVFGNR